MTYETLQYVDADGDTQEVALQNLSASGTVKTQFYPHTHAPSEFVVILPQPPEIPITIPFKSRCKIWACRLSDDGADNSFSGGTILFQGRRTDKTGEANASRVSTQITLSDAFWDLTKLTYQVPWNQRTGGTDEDPVFTTFVWPDVILFQQNLAGQLQTDGSYAPYDPAPVSNSITSWQQILAIINYALSYTDTATELLDLQIDDTPEFDPCYVNFFPVRSVKCMEALTTCLRPHPGVYTEIDYSTTPPTLHFRNRAAMTSTTLPYKSTDENGIIHISTTPQPLPELIPDRVALLYQINSTLNGQPSIGYDEDIYPEDAAPSLLSEDYSISITGPSIQKTIKNFSSETFDPTDKNLWRSKVASLKQISQGGQVPDDGDDNALAFVSTSDYDISTNPKGIQVFDDTNTPVDYSEGNFEFITADSVFAWFELDGGVAAAAKRVTVKAFFKYSKTSHLGGFDVSDQYLEHEHSFHCTLTNAPSNKYAITQLTNTGEAIPEGLAQSIWTELQDLQWKLSHEIFQVGADDSSIPTLIKPGRDKINLAGGDADWETIDAVPESVTIEFMRVKVGLGDGTTEWRLAARNQIKCGPVNHLEPGYLVQLYNLFANRNLRQINASQALTGSSSPGTTDLTATDALENSVPAPPVPIVSNNVFVNDGGTIGGQIIHSAKIISDILGATTPTPITGATTASIKTMQPREVMMCDSAGNNFYAIVHCSDGYTKA